MKRIPMTREGHEALKEEFKFLKTVERPRIIHAISEARAHGDLSENAEYHAAKEQQSMNETRLRELESALSLAEIIEPTGDVKSVTFGTWVRLVDEDTNEECCYRIVGDLEADVKKGHISLSSPIARALIGKKVGASIEVIAPGGERGYEILDISLETPTAILTTS